jgi:hypothetical protein
LVLGFIVVIVGLGCFVLVSVVNVEVFVFVEAVDNGSTTLSSIMDSSVLAFWFCNAILNL